MTLAPHLCMSPTTSKYDEREDEDEMRDVETSDGADIDDVEDDGRLPSSIDDDPKGDATDDDDDDLAEDLDLDDLAAMEGPDA